MQQAILTAIILTLIGIIAYVVYMNTHGVIIF